MRAWKREATEAAETHRLQAENAAAEALLKHRATLLSRLRRALFVVDSKGDSTELADAAFEGDIDTVQVLLLQGWNLESAGHDGYTALSEAACAGQIEIVKLLLELGADPNTCGTGAGAGGQRRTPLSRAVSGGHLDIAKLLLQAGAFARAARAGANWMSHQGSALLAEWDVERSEAAQAARQAAILKAVEQEAATWSLEDRRMYRLQRCRSKLLRLAETGDAAALREELQQLAVEEAEYGVEAPGLTADTRERVADGEGRTLLALATFHNHISVVRMLLTQWREIATCREVPAASSENKRNIGQSHRELPAMKLKAMQLKVFRVNINARFGPFNGADGWTALSLAAWKGHAQMVQLLRMHGANPLLGTTLARDAFSIATKGISLFSRKDKLGKVTTRLLTNAMREHTRPILGGSDNVRFLEDRRLDPLSAKLLQKKEEMLLLQSDETKCRNKPERGSDRTLKSMRTAAKNSSFYDLRLGIN